MVRRGLHTPRMEDVGLVLRGAYPGQYLCGPYGGVWDGPHVWIARAGQPAAPQVL